MSDPGWAVRLKYAALAALAGWLAGVVASLPFEAGIALRYADWNWSVFPEVLAKGMFVWSVFVLLIALAVLLVLVVPFVLLVPPRWIVRWRRVIVPASGISAVLLLCFRLHQFQGDNLARPHWFSRTFLNGPSVFVLVFAAGMPWVYAWLVRRRDGGGLVERREFTREVGAPGRN